MEQPVVFIHGTALPSKAANAVQTLQMAAAVATLGVPVHLACWLKPGWSEEDVFSYYGLPPTFSLVPGATSMLSRRGLRSIAMVAPLLRRFGRRWVCCTRIPSVAALVAWLGIPTVLELHSLTTHPRQQRLLPVLARAPGLRRVVVISQALRLLVEEQMPRLAHRSLTVAHDAVDPERFAVSCSQEEARRTLGLPLDTQIVGYTGRLSAGKGAHILLQAAKGTPFTTCIVGGDPSDPSDMLEQLKTEHALPETMFLGYQPPAKIPLFLRAFDVVVAPFTHEPISRFTVGGRVVPYDISGVMSPLKVFEYMASGTPMVVSDLPVLREVLTPGKTAVMVPPGDPDALRAGIDRLLQHPNEAAEMAETARQAVQDYTWEARARNIFGDLVD